MQWLQIFFRKECTVWNIYDENPYSWNKNKIEMTSIKFKALKTLVWQLSREPLKEMRSLKKYTNSNIWQISPDEQGKGWLVGWMVFYAAFNSISVISRRQITLFMSFLGLTSTRLELWRVLPKDTPTKKTPEDPVLLEPRTPGLRVKHFTTEPRRTPTRKGTKNLRDELIRGWTLSGDKGWCIIALIEIYCGYRYFQ